MHYEKIVKSFDVISTVTVKGNHVQVTGDKNDRLKIAFYEYKHKLVAEAVAAKVSYFKGI